MLENVPLFRGLSPAQLDEVVKLGERRKYKKNYIILSKDDATDYLFVLLSGRVDAYLDGDDGKKIIVNTIEPNETFGELAMLSSQPRSANIVAVEDCEVLIFQCEVIYKYIAEASEFCKNVIQMLARKVNALTDDVSSLALLDTYGRIARVLEKHAEVVDGVTTTGKLTQQEIADRVGSSREMVSRILKDLRVGGYISIDRKQIIIEKPLPKGW